MRGCRCRWCSAARQLQWAGQRERRCCRCCWPCRCRAACSQPGGADGRPLAALLRRWCPRGTARRGSTRMRGPMTWWGRGRGRWRRAGALCTPADSTREGAPHSCALMSAAPAARALQGQHDGQQVGRIGCVVGAGGRPAGMMCTAPRRLPPPPRPPLACPVAPVRSVTVPITNGRLNMGTWQAGWLRMHAREGCMQRRCAGRAPCPEDPRIARGVPCRASGCVSTETMAAGGASSSPCKANEGCMGALHAYCTQSATRPQHAARVEGANRALQALFSQHATCLQQLQPAARG